MAKKTTKTANKDAGSGSDNGDVAKEVHQDSIADAQGLSDEAVELHEPDAQGDDQASDAAADEGLAEDPKPPEEAPEAAEIAEETSDADAVHDDAPAEEPKPEPAATPPSREVVVEKRGGFIPLVLGGVLAAGFGVAASEFDWIDLGGANDATNGVMTEISALQGRIEEQAARIEEVASTPPPEPVLPEVDLTPLNTRISDLADRLGGIETRLTEVEKAPMTEGLSEAAIAAYERELAALQNSVEEQRAEVEALLQSAQASEADAAAEARAAQARAAMSRVISAIDSGAPFEDALAEVAQSGDAEIPAALSEAAADGVPTLATIQRGFQPAARAGLAAARANAPAGEGSGLGGFLERALNARSITPQEGDDPDAVLSRMEVAVQSGDLGEALREARTLPDAATEAMQEWLTMANTRHAAQQAADDVLTALSATQGD